MRDWFAPMWVNICIYVSDGETERFSPLNIKQEGTHDMHRIQELIHNFSLHSHVIEYDCPTASRLSYISVFFTGSIQNAPFCTPLGFLVIITEILMGLENHPLPASGCNFKRIIFDAMSKCQAALK